MTAELRVRRIESEDLEARVRWFNHPAISARMPLDVPISEAGTRQWLASRALDDTRRDFTFLVREDGASIPAAMGGLVDIDYRNRRCELYVLVDPDRHSAGIGTHAVRWLCDFAFTMLGLSRVFLYTTGDNEDARRFYERLGFVREGVLRRHQFHRGRMIDRVIHGLLEEDWRAQPWHRPDAVPMEIDLERTA